MSPYICNFRGGEILAERGFDPQTSELWAQHASTAPLWRFGVAVTRWSRSTQLLYIEPG